MTKRIQISPDVCIQQLNTVAKIWNCPKCGRPAKRHSLQHRWIKEAHPEKNLILEVTTSKHYCKICKEHFIKPSGLVPPSSNYSYRVHRLAVGLVGSGLTFKAASDRMRAEHHVQVPPTTIHEWCGEDKWQTTAPAVQQPPPLLPRG